MKKITKVLATSALVGGAVLAAPLAANAATYTPAGSSTCSSDVVTSGSTFTIVCVSGTFEPGSSLTINLSSTGPVPTDTTAAVFHAATATATGSANSTGGTTITGTVPANATADITVTATDPLDNSATGTIVIPASSVGTGAVGTSGTTGTTSTTGLATTGTYISLATIWGAVGLVALGGGAIAVRQITRKREQSNQA